MGQEWFFLCFSISPDYKTLKSLKKGAKVNKSGCEKDKQKKLQKTSRLKGMISSPSLYLLWIEASYW